jgi:hypothetical protein
MGLQCRFIITSKSLLFVILTKLFVLQGGTGHTFTELSKSKLRMFLVKQFSNSKQKGWTLVKKVVYLVIEE